VLLEAAMDALTNKTPSLKSSCSNHNQNGLLAALKCRNNQKFAMAFPYLQKQEIGTPESLKIYKTKFKS
jgi:hypothetical protein